jgi:alpha-amylase
MFWRVNAMKRDKVLPISGSIRPPHSAIGRGFAGVLALMLLLAGGALSSCAVTPVAQLPGTAPVTIVPQRDWSDAVLYFVLIDRFADGDTTNNTHIDRHNPGGYHGGDLQGLAQQLDEIATLGATAIWINPVVKQIETPLWAQGSIGSGWEGGFEHWAFHGYWAENFEQLEPHFGSEAELKALVEAAHARGLKVLLDVVYNHPGYGAHYLTDPETRHWIRAKPVDCAANPLTCQVGGLPDFRTELPEVRDYLFRAHLGLARRVGLDGFRLDTVKHVEHDFWQAHRARSRTELGQSFFLLGEVWGGSYEVLDPWFASDEMDGGFDFTFRGSCQGYVEGKGRTIAFAAYLKKRHQVRHGYHLAHYLSSHDEPMFLHELGNDLQKFKLCVALQMTSLGIPVIYYGEEVARRGGAWPTNRGDMPWGNRAVAPGNGVTRDEALRDFYRQLIALRRAHPALALGTFHELSTTGDLLVFARADETSGDVVIVAINRGEDSATAMVPTPRHWRGTTIWEVLSDSPAQLDGALLVIKTPPRTAQVYVAESRTTSGNTWPIFASRT